MPKVAGGSCQSALFGGCEHRPPGLCAQRSCTPLSCKPKADRISAWRTGRRPVFPCWPKRFLRSSICLSQSFSRAGWQPALPVICARLSRMLPVEHNDPTNEEILAISEDKIEGFVREPFQEIAQRSGVDADVVMARIAAMLRAGTIRRVRQTLLATNLADGALVAWKVPEEKIDAAFDFMFQRDPFSGQVVLRSTDTLTAGSDYKLWTTVKVPHGFSLEEHCRLLAGNTGAERFRIMPAKGIFTLGVGHVRRKTIEPGSRAESPAKIIEVHAVELSEREWKVLLALKREFTPEEIRPTPWVTRAREAGVSLEEFYRVAEKLNARKIIGRFSTFLEHVKPSAGGVRVTRFN